MVDQTTSPANPVPPNPPAQTPPAPAPPSQPAQPEIITPKKSFLSGKLLLLIIFILILIPIGWFSYQILNSKVGPAPIVSKAIPTSAPTPTPDPTASWKTYQGQGFTFKYPDNWFSQDNIESAELSAGTGFYLIGTTPHPGGADDPTNAQLNVQLSKNTQTNEQFISTASQTANYKKTLTIGGFPAIQTQIKNFKQYYIKYSTVNLLILTAYTDQAGKDLDVIISSIKFTDASQAIDTSTWKTYTSLESKISFKYPSNFITIKSAGNYNVFFVRSEQEKQQVEKCLEQTDCSSYPLGVGFRRIPKSSTETLSDVVKKDYKIPFEEAKFSSTVIAGFKALERESTGIGIGYYVYIENINFVLYIHGNPIVDAEENLKIYKTMLSTLQFTQ